MLTMLALAAMNQKALANCEEKANSAAMKLLTIFELYRILAWRAGATYDTPHPRVCWILKSIKEGHMNRLTKQLVLILGGIIAIASLNGCATSKDYISINYAAQTNVVRVAGADRVSVRVEVSDVRAIHDRVGNKKNGYGMEMASIISTNDVIATVQKAIQTELSNRGFKLADGDVTVLIELSKFYNEFKEGFWAGDAVAELTMSAQVKKSDGNIIYSKLVNGEGERLKIQLASGANAKVALEGALANAMVRLFGDPLFVDALLKASSH
jgi:uncharacterized lipoprotein YajG